MSSLEDTIREGREIRELRSRIDTLTQQLYDERSQREAEKLAHREERKKVLDALESCLRTTRAIAVQMQDEAAAAKVDQALIAVAMWKAKP